MRFTFDVNTLAHYWLAKEFVGDMAKKNHGMVVTVASYAAFVVAPNMVDYASSKAAAQAFHEGLALELSMLFYFGNLLSIPVPSTSDSSLLAATNAMQKLVTTHPKSALYLSIKATPKLPFSRVIKPKEGS